MMKVFTPEIESNAEFELIPAVAPSCIPRGGMRKLSPATVLQKRCSQQHARGARLEIPVRLASEKVIKSSQQQ